MKTKQQYYILRVKASTGHVFDVVVCVTSEFFAEFDNEKEMHQEVERTLSSLYGFEVCSYAFTSYWYPISGKDAREYYYTIIKF